MKNDNPNFQHKDYSELIEKWEQMEDALEGQCEVHEKGVRYLPSLSGQTKDEYLAYKKRALFFNATARTWDAFVGMVFRKDPVKSIPPQMQFIDNDATLTGVNLNALSRHVFGDVLAYGRCGVLIEYPNSGSALTRGEEDALNIRPYFAKYNAESIINWRYERINNKKKLSLVALKEKEEIQGDFATEEKEIIRVLRLIDGKYAQIIYEEKEVNGEKMWVDRSFIVPLKNGLPLDFIPFVAFGSEVNDLSEQYPPLLSLSDINFSHYRTFADLENGCHFTGLPTLFISGFQSMQQDAALGNDEIVLGSTKAIVQQDSQAKASFIEFTGQGLGALERMLDRKERLMAQAGARLLAQEKAQTESGVALQMRSNGETSVLASIANLVSDGFVGLLKMCAYWLNESGDIAFKLNTDYLPGGISAQDVESLMKLHQGGFISSETMFSNLQAGEIIQSSRTFDDEMSMIDTQKPVVL